MTIRSLLCVLFPLLASSLHGITLVPAQLTTPARFGNLLIFSQRIGTQLFAVDSKTKRQVWTWSSEERSVRTRPTLSNHVAYIWAGIHKSDSRACAIDCRTGKSIWETPAGGYTHSAAVVTEEAVLFSVDSLDGAIYAFDYQSGKLKWKFSGCSLLGVHGSMILATRESDTQLILIEAAHGKEVFRTKLDDEEFSEVQAAFTPEGLSVVASGNTLLCIDIPSRTIRWKEKTGNIWVPSIKDQTLYLLSGYPPIDEDSRRQFLELRNLQDGKPGRRIYIKAGDHTYFPALFFDNTVVIASGDFLVGLNARSLKEKWRRVAREIYQLEKEGETFFVGGYNWEGSENSYLWQVDAKSGKKIWSYSFKDPY